MSIRLIRGRYLFREVNERGFELPLGSVTKDGGVEFRSDLTISVWNPADDVSGYKRVCPDDFVIGLRSFQSGIGHSQVEALVSPAYTVLRPISEKVHPPFFKHLFKSSRYIAQLENVAQGIRQGRTIATADFYNIECPVPELATQRAIADYLDAETARIDALIAKKQRKITLLYERQAELERTAVIGATTTSTNAVVPTGNQLIPVRPATWRLVRARFLCSIETGSSDTDENSATGTYPFFVRSQTPQLSDRFIFDTEAVLTAGDGAGVGKVFHHFRGKFDAHQRVYVLHEFREVEARFFYYCFSAYFALAALDGSAKSTVDSVRRHMITEFPVPVPPREEQTRLVDFLDMTRARTERLVDLVTKELGLLRERRQALITAAVTGELEIPGVAA